MQKYLVMFVLVFTVFMPNLVVATASPSLSENELVTSVKVSTESTEKKEATNTELVNTPPLVIQENSNTNSEEIVETVPEVGKHAGTNMDPLTLIVALIMVLALILACAFILKRFQPHQSEYKGLKIITSLSLGAKERLMVVQVGDKQQLLGVTAQQITLLDTLDEPLKASVPMATELGQSFVSLLKNNFMKTNSSKNTALNK